MAETAVYAYCIVQRDRRPALQRLPPGVPQASAPELTEVVPSLWLVSAAVPLSVYAPDLVERRLQDLEWVSRIALAHEAVVERFSRVSQATVVPFKLFTMFSTVSRALSDLRSRRRELESVARRIRGADEWGVRIARRPQAARTTRPAGPDRAGSGAAFLAARKHARDEARARSADAARAAEQALHTLARHARALRRQAAPDGAVSPPLLEAAFLVPSTRRTRFKLAVRREAERCRRAGAQLTLTGPWPAYNFIQAEDARS